MERKKKPFFSYLGAQDVLLWPYWELWDTTWARQSSTNGAGSSNVAQCTNEETPKVKIGLTWDPRKNRKKHEMHQKNMTKNVVRDKYPKHTTIETSTSAKVWFSRERGFKFHDFQGYTKLTQNLVKMRAKVSRNMVWKGIAK